MTDWTARIRARLVQLKCAFRGHGGVTIIDGVWCCKRCGAKDVV